MLLQAERSVAIDATNLTKARRVYWQNIWRLVVPDIQTTIVWCCGNWDSPSRWIKERGYTEEKYLQIQRRLEASVELPTADEAYEVLFFTTVICAVTAPLNE